MKTSELTGVALDWAVAKCVKPEWLGNQAEVYVLKVGFHPSTDWALAGPIIERERICVIATPSANWDARSTDYPPRYVSGQTPLEAAMRCYVASKLGDEIQLPDTLERIEK